MLNKKVTVELTVTFYFFIRGETQAFLNFLAGFPRGASF